MQNKNVILIAIDGPAAAGKTTIAEQLSSKLGILYLNTGAMYRAAGLHALRLKVDPLNETQIQKFLDTLNIDVNYINKKQRTYLNKEDVTHLLTNQKVSEYASKISSIASVRVKMVALQQKLSKQRSLIVDGRDITTVVLPNATYKFYLDAKVQERAKRRHIEQVKKGYKYSSYQTTLSDIKQRDERDSTRKHSPLTLSKDAIYIDSTNKSINKIVNTMLNHIKV